MLKFRKKMANGRSVMKTIVLILCVLFVGCATMQANDRGYDYGKGTGHIGMANGRLVFRLADGRVVELLGIKGSLRGNEHHVVTLNYVSRMVKGRRVRLVFDSQRRNEMNHVLAYVYVGSVFVNAELVRKGYAYAIPTPGNTMQDATFVELERLAQSGRLVIWKKLDDLF